MLLNSHFNIFSRFVHIRFIQEMVLKTLHKANIKYTNSSKCRKNTSSSTKFFTYVVINDVHYNVILLKQKSKYDLTSLFASL